MNFDLLKLKKKYLFPKLNSQKINFSNIHLYELIKKLGDLEIMLNKKFEKVQ